MQKKDYIDLEKGLYIGKGVPLKINNFVFGDEDKKIEDIYIPWKDINGHTFVLGSTRTGKTRLMMSIVRQLVHAGYDIFLLDPKGSFDQEIIGWTLEFLEEAGRLNDYYYISPMFPEYSYPYFNPLYYLTNEEIASLVSSLIEAKEEFYVNIGYEIVMAICTALEYLEAIMPKSKVEKIIKEEYDRFYTRGTLVDEIYNIRNPSMGERIIKPPTIGNIDNHIPPLRTLVTLSDLAAYSTREGLETLRKFIENLNSEILDIDPQKEKEMLSLKLSALRMLNDQLAKPKDYFSKVASSYNLILSKLSSGRIGQILSSTKINPIIDRLYDKDRGNMFLIQPFPLVFKSASDAFVKIFFQMMSAIYGRVGASGRRLPRPVALLIDEGGSVIMPETANLFNKAGGLGLSIFIFSQSFSDYDAAVGEDNARIIADNTNIKIYLRANDELSRKRIADSFGMEKKANMNMMGSRLDTRGSVQFREENLVSPAQVSKLPPQHFLFQYKEKSYVVKAPDLEDPKYLIDMPKTDSELQMVFAKSFEQEIEKYREKTRIDTEKQITETLKLKERT